MDVDLIFKIAAIGILVAVLNQLLIRSGREEQAMMTTLEPLFQPPVQLPVFPQQLSLLLVSLSVLLFPPLCFLLFQRYWRLCVDGLLCA